MTTRERGWVAVSELLGDLPDGCEWMVIKSVSGERFVIARDPVAEADCRRATVVDALSAAGYCPESVRAALAQLEWRGPLAVV